MALANLTECHQNGCGCTTFHLEICHGYGGIVYECTKCGYVHTYWFGGDDD